MRGVSSYFAAVLLAFATGCHPHVKLTLPPASASFHERVEAYQQLRPERMKSTTYVGVGVVNTSSRAMDYLQLGSGQRVYYPEDLRPLVRKESPTAAHIDTSVGRRTLGLVLVGGVVALLATGAALSGSYVMADPEKRDKTMLWGGLGCVGAGIGLGITAQWAGSSSTDAAEAAYRTYDSELRLQLGVSPTAR
jgi:hypothetical protein